MSDRQGIVSFPVIGVPVPDPTFGPENFLRWIDQGQPHWIYHLRVSRPPRHVRRRFPLLSVRELDLLAAALRLPPGPYEVELLEMVLGKDCMPAPGERSAFAFPLHPHPNGDSFLLAVAVGLVAAATGRPLPSWVLLSGCLVRDPHLSLRLSTTRRIRDKVLLARAAEPGHDLRPVLDALYRHPSTADWLGPRAWRTESGRVRLLVIPEDVDVSPADLAAPLAVEPVAACLTDFGQARDEDLLAAVARLAGDDLLVIQVSSVAHALYLLGCHHVHPPVLDGLGPEALARPLRAFRVHHTQPADSEPGSPLFGRQEVQMELALLEVELARAADVHEKIKVVLERCAALLACASGQVCCLVPGRNLLRVLARSGLAVQGVPPVVPSDLGIIGRTLRTGQPAVVPVTADDLDFLDKTAVARHMTNHGAAEEWRAYLTLLRQIKACVILPLKAGEQVVGVLGLHHNEARPWDTRRLKVVEAFADRAGGLVEEFLAIEARVQQILLPEGPGGHEQALERAVDQAVGRYLTAADGPLAQREAALIDGVFRGLLAGVDGRLGWAGLLDDGEAAFLWQGTAGDGGDRALSLAPAAVLRELRREPFVLSDPGDGRPLAALLDVLPEAERQGATACQCLAVPMAGAGRTVAVFFVVLGPGERVEPERAQRAADLLRRAGNLVALGRQAVPTTQAACGLTPDGAG